MSKLTRFEFGGVGIFHALDILEDMPFEKQDEEDLAWAEREFEQTLEIPDILNENEGFRELYSFFTELGLAAFESCLDIFCNLFYEAEDAGLGKLRELTIDSSDLKIVYQDEYQVVVEISQQEMKKLCN